MKISEFNKVLANKILKAKGLENNNNIKEAIALWLEISEMALNFSKSRNIDSLFRNMIINRTKGIFEHIKKLKAGQYREEIVFEKANHKENVPKVETSSDTITNFEKVKPELKEQENNLLKSAGSNNPINEVSNLKNIPSGFKEIKTSETFKIITPHDDNYIKEHLSQQDNSVAIKDKKQQLQEETHKLEEKRFEFEQPKDGEALICFACGFVNSTKEDKICQNCKTELI